MLADRMSRLSSSPTMKVTAAVDRLRRDGVEIIDFGAGEPDFATPDPIGAAAHEAIDRHFTKYTPVGGIAELKRAIAARYRADYGVDYRDDEIIACAGGKQALFNTALALFSAGDEVILHAPCWPTLVEQVKLAEARPVVVSTSPEDGFAIRPAPILDAITARTRGIIINSPCNPTGALISEADLAILAQEAARRRLWIVVDLCYEQLIYDDVPHNLPGVLNRYCRDLAVMCGSASKAYAMTGWRCGWTLAPAAVIAAESAIQSHATSNVSSITQKAVLAALTGSQEPVAAMRREYRMRRDQMLEWLGADRRLRCTTPAGAFYLFVDVSDVLSVDVCRTSAEFADQLLGQSRVAVTPGEAFDAPGFIRISYATSMEALREGTSRLLDFVHTLAARTPSPDLSRRSGEAAQADL
jgi:aspartate aminotransferase